MKKVVLTIVVIVVLIGGLIHPVPNASATSAVSITCQKAVAWQTCQAEFKGEIVGVKEYKHLINILNSQTAGDSIVIHLAGPGGDADTAIAIIDAMKRSAGRVLVSVDGDVASAHAMIAISGRMVRIAPGSIFLFHKAAPVIPIEQQCQRFRGETDRGQDMEQKCVNFYGKKLLEVNTYLIKSMQRILTHGEVLQVIDGYDVIIGGPEVAKRVGLK